MIEPARRHGHFDPRFRLAVAATRPPKLTLVSDAPRSIHRNGDIPDAAPARRLVLAGGGSRDDAGVTDWENEGGCIVEPEPGGPVEDELAAGLDWYEFLAVRFPGGRRHDLDALKAYEAYRSSMQTTLG